MKSNKLQKIETANLKLAVKKVQIPKSQLKGIKGGIVEEIADGI